MKATTDQHAAITRQDRALLVEAGAGTGKTWVLVERFLHLLETHPDWPLGGITAVTFTEKAAREMRDRIRRGIESRAANTPAGSHWHERRRSLEQLAVSTIHGLCSRILRENAIAAGIDPQFEVLDEQDSALVKQEALELTLTQLAADDDPALEVLSTLRAWDLQEELASLLARRGTMDHLFQNLPEPVECLALWQQGLEQMRRAVWSDLRKRQPQLDDALRDIPTWASSDPSDKLIPHLQAAQQALVALADGRYADAVERLCSIKVNVGRAAAWGGKAAKDELKSQLEVLRDAGKALMANNCHLEIGELDKRAADALALWRQLWDRLTAVYDGLKTERQALDFDDLERLTRRLLDDHPDDERLQTYLEGVRHLMVDEFQDTNEVQWEIVSRLAPPPSGKLFLVGDAKQSIYRFRQAQVSIFRRTARQLAEAAEQPSPALRLSFRAHEMLVAALNHLFDRVLQPLGEEYSDYEARPGPLQANRPTPPAATSPVELTLLPKKTPEGEEITIEDVRLFEANLIAARLLELRRQEYPVWDKAEQCLRPFRFGDAAILFRATTDIPLYEERFRIAGLPYLTISGRGYYDRPEIRDLTALLAALHNPYDDLSLAAVLRSPLFSLSDETLYRLRRHAADGSPAAEPRPYRDALALPPATDQPEQIGHATAVLEELWRACGRESAWRLLRLALDRTGYEAVMAELDAGDAGGGRRVANLAKLLTLAYERGGTGLSAFLRQLDRLRDREVREGEAPAGLPEAGAVQLMSVHAAKGLEFPVVAVADMGRAAGGFGRAPVVMGDPAFGLVCQDRDDNGDWVSGAGFAWARWLDRRMDRAESNRVLYVACTRAADLLLLSGCSEGSRGDNWLKQVLEAWPTDSQGQEDEVLQLDGFGLRLRRPAYVEPVPAAKAPARGRPAAGDGAQPLDESRIRPVEPGLGAVAATALPRLLGDDPVPVRPFRTPDKRHGTALGDLVHLALSQWDCLAEDAGARQERLARWALRLGLTEPLAFDIVERAEQALSAFLGSDLYRRASVARERYTELPFALPVAGSTVRGALDLLFRDEQGGWTLVDWKTNYVPAGEASAKAEREHRTQLAVYAQAARAFTGEMPKTVVCFLRPTVREVAYARDVLEKEWERVCRALRDWPQRH